MITNNFNKELRGISDALRDLGYPGCNRYAHFYCVILAMIKYIPHPVFAGWGMCHFIYSNPKKKSS